MILQIPIRSVIRTDYDRAAVSHDYGTTQCCHIELAFQTVDNDQLATCHGNLHPLTTTYYGSSENGPNDYLRVHAANHRCTVVRCDKVQLGLGTVADEELRKGHFWPICTTTTVISYCMHSILHEEGFFEFQIVTQIVFGVLAIVSFHLSIIGLNAGISVIIHFFLLIPVPFPSGSFHKYSFLSADVTGSIHLRSSCRGSVADGDVCGGVVVRFVASFEELLFVSLAVLLRRTATATNARQ
mmetsp:Transcript_27986/g.39800  ORF Transcript_27986/g.39800 Transcript_27986/m.39800 type:complete len:241 (+) Transcript_27986:692-1414(+)